MTWAGLHLAAVDAQRRRRTRDPAGVARIPLHPWPTRGLGAAVSLGWPVRGGAHLPVAAPPFLDRSQTAVASPASDTAGAGRPRSAAVAFATALSRGSADGVLRNRAQHRADAGAGRPPGAWRSRRACGDSARAGSVCRRRGLRAREAGTTRCRLPSIAAARRCETTHRPGRPAPRCLGRSSIRLLQPRFRSAASPGSPQWSLLASGAVATERPTRQTHPRRTAPARAIAASCPDVITGSSFYRRLAEHGLQYGPGFAAVEQIWRRDGEAVARLIPPDATATTSRTAGFWMPPSRCWPRRWPPPGRRATPTCRWA